MLRTGLRTRQVDVAEISKVRHASTSFSKADIATRIMDVGCGPIVEVRRPLALRLEFDGQAVELAVKANGVW